MCVGKIVEFCTKLKKTERDSVIYTQYEKKINKDNTEREKEVKKEKQYLSACDD
jgi:hypothetical protein